MAYNLRVPGPCAEPIDAQTRYCAVYGFPVKHSASPAMHNAALPILGLNWRYLAFEVEPAKLRPAIEGAQSMGFIGLNLTVPHKLLAVEMVDALDESARDFGAVNTIRFEGKDAGGHWLPLSELPQGAHEVRSHGFNTDAEAVTRAIREDLGLDLQGASVILLGAGGAGRTAALKLAAEGVGRLSLVNRTREKADDLANEIRRRAPRTKVLVGYPDGNVDLVLNATSLGLKPDDSLPYSETEFAFKSSMAVYDMIYRPAQTPFLKQAKQAGCRVANGLGMLLYQGARALELWTGKPAPVAAMRQALQAHMDSHG